MYEYKEGWWETKDHRKIKIEDMDTQHIKNTINYLERHHDFYDRYYGDMYEPYEHEDNSYLVDKKIKELQHELDRRKSKKWLLVWEYHDTYVEIFDKKEELVKDLNNLKRFYPDDDFRYAIYFGERVEDK